MYLCGGGIVGHPMGPAAGVRAIRQAWDAAAGGQTLAASAKNHPELAASLARWGAGSAAQPEAG